MTDVFAVQDEIAEAIVNMLKGHLVRKTTPLVRHSTSLEAYHANLKGWYHFLKMTLPGLGRSRAYFEEAIALDPNYAPAHLGLARCFLVSPVLGGKPSREVMPLAKAAALKAVQLDEREPEGHVLLGQVAGQFEYNWREALRRYRLALDCGTMSPMARFNSALFILMPLHRFDEALTLIEPTLKADPLSPLPRAAMAAIHTARGAFDFAKEELHRVLELEDYWFAHWVLGMIHAAKGMTSEAITAWEKGLQLVPYPAMIGALAGLYAQAGDGARAQGHLARLATPELAHGCAMGYGYYHLLCREYDPAADQFERAIEARDPSAILLSYILLAGDLPRRRALLQKMNLVDVET